MSDRNCPICLDALCEGDAAYHTACCKKLFGTNEQPILPYTWEGLNSLAEQVIRQHVAVPGVQPKLSLHLDRKGKTAGGRLTLVGLAGGYILKPPVARYPEMPELEHLTMLMARQFGIETAECGLIPLEDGQRAFITRRMDRPEGNKLHMEDLCQLTDRLTEQKYRSSMEQAGRAVLRYCSNPLFEALRLFDLTVFCFLTGNADMHLKNFSLLYAPGREIRLAPAYDLLPSVLLLPEDPEETALTLNGKKRNLRPEDFLKFGAALQLTERQIQNSLRRISTAMDSGLALIERGFCSGEMKVRYRALISERSARLFG
jgi:serine/threonine-protein kinase HipA